MGDARRVYGTIESRADLERIFQRLADEVDQAESRLRLTELHKRALYLVVLTRAPSWRSRFDDEADALGAFTMIEFVRTVRRINQRARAIGTWDDYSDAA